MAKKVIQKSPEAKIEKVVKALVAESKLKPEPTEFQKRLQAAKDRVYAKRDAFLAAEAGKEKVKPPFQNPEIVSTYVLAGKTIAEWSAVIEARKEAGGVLDLTDLPNWVCLAVEIWKATGRPTPATETLNKITEMRAEAEKMVNFANLDKDKASRMAKTNPEKAKKLLDAAEKKSQKAQALFDEANKLAAEHKEK